ncbi:MAG: hypothetical protein ACRCUE_09935 [Bosea sp. (in: a-proteobacteria)]
MVKRTYPAAAGTVIDAADMDDVVQDKREGWRASTTKARRRDRRYKNLLTREMLKIGSGEGEE